MCCILKFAHLFFLHMFLFRLFSAWKWTGELLTKGQVFSSNANIIRNKNIPNPRRIFLIAVRLSFWVLLAAQNMIKSLPSFSPNCWHCAKGTGLWFKPNPYPNNLYFFLNMNEVTSLCICLQLYIRKGRKEREDGLVSQERNTISQRSWKIGLQVLTLQIHSEFAFHLLPITI